MILQICTVHTYQSIINKEGVTTIKGDSMCVWVNPHQYSSLPGAGLLRLFPHLPGLNLHVGLGPLLVLTVHEIPQLSVIVYLPLQLLHGYIISVTSGEFRQYCYSFTREERFVT